MNKPMLLINPIPGQEEKNINYVVSTGLGEVLEDENLWFEIWNKFKKINQSTKPPSGRAANIILDNILKII
jgi:UDP-N-acetylglucosamine:LPS N-acetylglucosamine transferase